VDRTPPRPCGGVGVTAAAVAGPPGADQDSFAFWGHLRAHRLVLSRCDSCESLRYPPMPTCPYCASRDATDAEMTGHGTVYSWIAVDRPLDAAFADQVPYAVAIVELDEGPRLAARVSGDVEFGRPVCAIYVDHEVWTELRFTTDLHVA
jgi:uncharacterized protein